jgi:hypothetical protein
MHFVKLFYPSSACGRSPDWFDKVIRLGELNQQSVGSPALKIKNRNIVMFDLD